MTQDQLWNIADCATRRGIHYLLNDKKARASREFDVAETFQRWHSYTVIDLPIGCGPMSVL